MCEYSHMTSQRYDVATVARRLVAHNVAAREECCFFGESEVESSVHVAAILSRPWATASKSSSRT